MPNRLNRPDLSVTQILAWADAHRERTGRWPTSNSGVILEAPDEKWSAVNTCLMQGNRGRPIVEAPEETWGGVQVALSHGNRGLPGGSSLAQLLAEQRGVPERMNRSLRPPRPVAPHPLQPGGGCTRRNMVGGGVSAPARLARLARQLDPVSRVGGASRRARGPAPRCAPPPPKRSGPHGPPDPGLGGRLPCPSRLLAARPLRSHRRRAGRDLGGRGIGPAARHAGAAGGVVTRSPAHRAAGRRERSRCPAGGGLAYV